MIRAALRRWLRAGWPKPGAGYYPPAPRPKPSPRPGIELECDERAIDRRLAALASDVDALNRRTAPFLDVAWMRRWLGIEHLGDDVARIHEAAGIRLRDVLDNPEAWAGTDIDRHFDRRIDALSVKVDALSVKVDSLSQRVEDLVAAAAAFLIRGSQVEGGWQEPGT